MGKLVGFKKREEGYVPEKIDPDKLVADSINESGTSASQIEEEKKESFSNAQMAKMMGVDPSEFQRMIDTAGPSGSDDPFAGLNLNREQKRRAKIHKINTKK